MAKEARSEPVEAAQNSQPHLRRVLGRWDLVLLLIVAVVNLNLVPVVAAGGAVVMWLWALALLCFFLPQGIAVIEFSHRYPGEGGVYLWTKALFGDFHGFISGWCYWTNNVFYVPTLLFYLFGISIYVGGAKTLALGDRPLVVFATSVALFWIMVWLNVRGLGVGKWVNNLGGIGAGIATVALIGLSVLSLARHGSRLAVHDFVPASLDWHILPLFGVVCFQLVGLELGSMMGDEIQEPRKIVPPAVLWGGIISGVLLVAATLALLTALPAGDIGVVQGVMQAIGRMAADAGAGWIVPVLAVVLSISISGTTSAWLAGSARIPFVAGLDAYLPPALGLLHPRYATPYIALIVHASVSTVFIAISFFKAATVQEAYVTMLTLAVILQLVPYLYLFAGLVKLAERGNLAEGFYERRTLILAGVFGFIVTAFGVALPFLPSAQITSVWVFEIKLAAGCTIFIGLAALLFRVGAARKPTTAVREAATASLPSSGDGK